MWITLGILAVFVVVAIYACLRVASDEERKEDEQ